MKTINLLQLRKIISEVAKDMKSFKKSKMLNEGFTQRELEAWKAGDFEYDSSNDETDKDPCDCCDEMTPSKKLEVIDQKYLCKQCAQNVQSY